MSCYTALVRPFLFALPPEAAHRLAVAAVKRGGWLRPHPPAPSLRVEAFGLSFPSPIGLAAGFDKNAEAARGLLARGFGFVEAGTVTPLPQAGNPRPRLFRLVEDEALINRLGFNNLGGEAFVRNMRRRSGGIVGANIGKNRDSADAVADYVTMLEAVSPYADYVTVNISSPNTQGLRDLQHGEALDALLSALAARRAALSRRVPMLLKIAPDLTMPQREAIAQAVLAHGVDGLIVSNTTLSRPPGLQSGFRGEQGGLSGRPLAPLSLEVLRSMRALTGGRIPLVSVGGIGSGEEAYARIRAGASLVQLYTALVYQGTGLVARMHASLAQLLARDGFTRLADAVGADSA